MVMLVNAAAGMAVPLVTGLWSDRLQHRGLGRRMPFIVGGTVVTAGGLLAIALGFTTSYLVLALFGRRRLHGVERADDGASGTRPETFDETGRARATSAQELALLAGGLLGLAAGGASLRDRALGAVRAGGGPRPAARDADDRPRPRARGGRRGARQASPLRSHVLPARTPASERRRVSPGSDPLGGRLRGAAGVLPPVRRGRPFAGARRRVAVARGFRARYRRRDPAAGRVHRPALHRPLLLLGVVLLGGGFLGVAASTSLPVVGAALVVGATGFGLVSTLGFPLFATLIPSGEAGGYTALLLLGAGDRLDDRAPGRRLDGGGDRELPRALRARRCRNARRAPPARRHPSIRGRARTAIALLAAVPVLGLLVAQTAIHRLDEELFGVVNDLGPGPEMSGPFSIRTRGTTSSSSRSRWRLARSRRCAGFLECSRRCSARRFSPSVLLEAIYAVYDRPRPEEVLTTSSLAGRTWAQLNSFPSGHMAITAALSASMALLFPRLRVVLFAYVGAIGLTRVVFGAHFPLDVLAGTMLGVGSALLVADVAERLARALEHPGQAEPYDEDAPVAAVMPSYNDVPSPALVEATLEHVHRLVLVDDGSDPEIARALDAVAAGDRHRVELVRLPLRAGKGSAVRAGVEHARKGAGAVVVIDADGQHLPSAIPALVAAGRDAELVVGDRFGDLRSMPYHRRLANRTTRRLFQLFTGREVRDTQSGMRLLRGRAIDLLPDGGYEAETRHLREVLDARLPVAWVPIPAIYENEGSSFRAGRDSLRVLWAIVQPL